MYVQNTNPVYLSIFEHCLMGACLQCQHEIVRLQMFDPLSNINAHLHESEKKFSCLSTDSKVKIILMNLISDIRV